MNEYLGWPPPKRWANNSLGDCLVFPCFLPEQDAPYARRIKPTHPHADRRGKKTRERKYESPKGIGPVVYFPPRSLRKLDQGDRKVWTEGEKKSLLLDQLGYTCVGLTGVTLAHNTATRHESGRYTLHPLTERYVRIEGCDHVIVFDSDTQSKPEVKRAALVLARMLGDAGAKSVSLAVPPPDPAGAKCGVDDYYMLIERSGESGAKAIAQLLDNGEPLDPTTLDMRPRIVLSTDESRCIDAASRTLIEAPEVYVRARKLVRVDIAETETRIRGMRRPVGSPTIETLPVASLREVITRFARVVSIDEEGAEKPAHPPRWLTEGLHCRGQWPGMREVTGVVETPLLRADGSVLTGNGYDAETGLIVRLASGLDAIDVEEQPSQEQAAHAAQRLLELVSDFPFCGDADRAAWLAGLLTPFAREAFDGPAPFFLIDAACKRTGKTLLAEVTGAIVLGRHPGAAGYVHDDTEMSKRITSIAKGGSSFVLIDNIDGPFGVASLDRAMTATTWKERLLGTNDEPELPLRCTWFGTSNNARFTATMDARTVPVRLVSDLERPELRTGFRYPDVIGHALQYRAEYVSDALTILRGFVAHGRPADGLSTLGKFEGWVRLVAGAVHWAMRVDPLLARKHIESVGDPELEALRALLEGLIHMGAAKTTHALPARDILERIQPHSLPPVLEGAREALDELVRRKPGAPITPKWLGRALKSCVDRPVQTSAGMVRLRCQSSAGLQYWYAAPFQSTADWSDWTNGGSSAGLTHLRAIHIDMIDRDQDPGGTKPFVQSDQRGTGSGWEVV